MRRLISVTMAAAGVLAGCDQAPRKPAEPVAITPSEIADKVRSSVRLKPPFLVVEDSLLGDRRLLSPNHPWSVDCGTGGAKIIFSPGIEVVISHQTQPRHACDDILDAAGKTIIEIAGKP